MRLLRRMILGFIFSLICNILFAQTGTIEGRVYDDSTDEGIPFANVALYEGGALKGGATTDMNGKYMIKPVSADTYDIKVSYVGYQPKKIKEVVVAPGKTVFQDFPLIEGVELNEVKVLEYRKPMYEKDQTTVQQTFTSVEIERIPQRATSGIAASSAGISQKAEEQDLEFRGSRSYSEDIYIDGIKVRTVRQNLLSGNMEKRTVDEHQFDIDPGKLTAGHLNDFGKWEGWKSLQAEELETHKQMWEIMVKDRLTVQVRSENGGLVLDAVVQLRNESGGLIWEARTDNTGKAELWGALQPSMKETERDYAITVQYLGNTYDYDQPVLFDQGINEVELPVHCRTLQKVDVAFVVDATSSMDDEIHYLKSTLVNIIQRSEALDPDVSFHTGSVFYRCAGNAYMTKRSPITDEVQTTLDFIRQQQSAQGGTEAVEEAMYEAVHELEWHETARARLLFLVLDESPGRADSIKQRLRQTMKAAAKKGIRVIPIVASGINTYDDKQLEYLMRCYALATNGTYVFLTDHSGVGNTHTKPSTNEYKVKPLNDLLVQLIYQYTYVPACNKAEVPGTKQDTGIVYHPDVLDHVVLDSSVTYASKQLDTIRLGEEEPLKKTSRSPSREHSETDTSLHHFRYYPNPTTGPLTIEVTGKVEQFYLADISGKLVRQFRMEGRDKKKVNLSSLTPGIYFLRYRLGEQWLSGKVVFTR